MTNADDPITSSSAFDVSVTVVDDDAAAVKKEPTFDLSLMQQQPLQRKLSTQSQLTSTSSTSISFCLSVVDSIEPTLHLDDITEEERQATWYGKEELSVLKRSRKEVAVRMDMGETVECSRGLEGKTKSGNRRRQMDILNAVNAVLDEQDNQFDCGANDSESIAQIYRMYSRSCQEQAVARGKTDAEEVQTASTALTAAS